MGASPPAERAPGAEAQELGLMGLAALQKVGSFWTRDEFTFPCGGREILNHWTAGVLTFLT